MKAKPIKLPNYNECSKKGQELTKKLFKAQVNDFYRFIKKWLKKEQHDYVIVDKPNFVSSGMKATIRILVDDRRHEFDLVISHTGIGIYDCYDALHYFGAVVKQSQLLKNLKVFIGTFIPH